LFGNFLILERNNVVQKLHEGDLCSDGVVEIGKLRSDGSGTNHNHRSGLFLQRHRLAVADDLFAVLFQGRQLTGARAGGDNDMIRFVFLFLTFSGSYLYFFTGQCFTGSFQEVDLVFLEEEVHPVAHTGGYIPAAFDHAFEIRRGLAFKFDAIVAGMLHIVEDLCTFQKRFGGDTAPVETNAAHRFFFNNCCFHTKLRSPDGGHVSAWTTSYHNQIVFHILLF